MSKIQLSLLQAEVESSLKFCRVVKVSKIILGACVLAAYFFDFSWLQELLVLSVVICLIVPLGFFDVFIQKLLEYNTQLVEEGQLLNATEANRHFGLMNERIENI